MHSQTEVTWPTVLQGQVGRGFTHRASVALCWSHTGWGRGGIDKGAPTPGVCLVSPVSPNSPRSLCQQMRTAWWGSPLLLLSKRSRGHGGGVARKEERTVISKLGPPAAPLRNGGGSQGKAPTLPTATEPPRSCPPTLSSPLAQLQSHSVVHSMYLVNFISQTLT